MSAPLHAMLESLSWLLGTWRSDSGTATYPTMQPFKFGAEIEFTHIGQPNIHFSSLTWKADDPGKRLHRETGFIRVQPETNNLAFISAQNIGLTTIEEGTFGEKKFTVECHSVVRLSFVTQGTKTQAIRRTFMMEGENLVQTVAMATSETPMTHHLSITCTRVP